MRGCPQEERADTHSLRFLRLRSGQAGQAPVRPYEKMGQLVSDDDLRRFCSWRSFGGWWSEERNPPGPPYQGGEELVGGGPCAVPLIRGIEGVGFQNLL